MTNPEEPGAPVAAGARDAADATEALTACLAQLNRTAAWLRSLPLARFGQDGDAVELQARELIGRVHACVLELCQALRVQVTESGGGGDVARAVHDADCPPADALPDHLGVHALGDQLAVHAADLARCGRACAAAGVVLPQGHLESLAGAALRLRSGS